MDDAATAYFSHARAFLGPDVLAKKHRTDGERLGSLRDGQKQRQCCRSLFHSSPVNMGDTRCYPVIKQIVLQKQATELMLKRKSGMVRNSTTDRRATCSTI